MRPWDKLSPGAVAVRLEVIDWKRGTGKWTACHAMGQIVHVRPAPWPVVRAGARMPRFIIWEESVFAPVWFEVALSFLSNREDATRQVTSAPKSGSPLSRVSETVGAQPGCWTATGGWMYPTGAYLEAGFRSVSTSFDGHLENRPGGHRFISDGEEGTWQQERQDEVGCEAPRQAPSAWPEVRREVRLSPVAARRCWQRPPSRHRWTSR